MVRRQTHQEQGHQKDIPGQRSDIKRVERVKIVACRHHKNTTELAGIPDQKTKPGGTEQTGESRNQPIRTALNKRDRLRREKIVIQRLEGRTQIILIKVKK